MCVKCEVLRLKDPFLLKLHFTLEKTEKDLQNSFWICRFWHLWTQIINYKSWFLSEYLDSRVLTKVLFVCEMVWFSRTVLSPIYWVSPTIPIPARKRESYATLKLNLSRMLWLSKTLPTSEREGRQICKKQKMKWKDTLSILCFFLIETCFYQTRVRSLGMLVTNSLTDWLPFNKFDCCDPGAWRCLLKTC